MSGGVGGGVSDGPAHPIFLFSPPSGSGFPLAIGSSVAFPGFAAETDRQMLGLLRLGLRDANRQYPVLVERMGLVGIDGVREPQRAIEVAGDKANDNKLSRDYQLSREDSLTIHYPMTKI